MSNAPFNTQSAVYGALTSDTGVTALLGSPARLYDHVPAGTVFPYAVFGTTHIDPLPVRNEVGFEQIITIELYSRYKGSKEVKDIFAAVHNALDRRALGISGVEALSCRFHSADFGLDNDGLTYRALVRFSIIVREF